MAMFLHSSCLKDVVDYVPLIYEETFTPTGDPRQCIPLTLFNDSNVEDTEFFFAHLTGNGDVNTDVRNVTRVFITDANGEL